VSTAAQAANGVLAAAMANGGDDEKTSHPACCCSPISPSRVALANPTIATMEKGEIGGVSGTSTA
jgi:putative spermidine/putrescine transport system substrate-binding protein